MAWGPGKGDENGAYWRWSECRGRLHSGALSPVREPDRGCVQEKKTVALAALRCGEEHAEETSQSPAPLL